MIKSFTVTAVALFISVTAFAQNPAPCSNIFISEYVEGTSFNKAIELYNPTQGTVLLSRYKLWMSFNGGVSTSSIKLQGSLAPGATHVIANSQAGATLLALANQTTAALSFNGNDAIAIIDSLTGDTIDIFGIIGDDPGLGGWTTYSGDETTNMTLKRMDTVHNGQLDWFNYGYGEWEALMVDEFSFLGSHTMTACTAVNNPEVSFINSSQTVGEGWFDVDVLLNITYPNGNPTTVTIALEPGGTATQGVDFTLPTPSTVTFPANSALPVAYNVLITEDTQLEPTEFFILKIQSVNNNGTFSTQHDTIFIEDNDSQMLPPTVYLNPATQNVTEGNTSVIMQVEILGANATPTSVTVSVAGSSTATQGIDFTFSGPTVTFPANNGTSQVFTVTILDDAFNESTETIVLKLINPTNNAVVLDSAIIHILDNDPPSPAVSFGPASQDVNENAGTATVQVDITNANAMPTSVDVSVAPSSTATAGSDFTFSTQTITFPASSSTSIPVNVDIIDDVTTETTETIVLVFTNPTNGATIGDSAVIRILDNDPDAIQNLMQHGINVWPNPASSHCNVTTNDMVQRFDIYNSIGQRMLSTEPMSNTFKIDIHELPSGIYNIQAVTADGLLHFRFMKK